MIKLDGGRLLERGDWETIQNLEKRVEELESNVSNLVIWAMGQKSETDTVASQPSDEAVVVDSEDTAIQ